MMSKFFYLGVALMLLASCGSSETTKSVEEVPDSFGYEMPPEAIEIPEEYEGTGNLSDSEDKPTESQTDGE